MLELLCIAIIFLVISGIALYLFAGSHTSKTCPKKNDCFLYTVLCVKNNEAAIEGLVRKILWEAQKSNRYTSGLIVVDFGSTDKTFSILSKLSTKYPFVQPMEKDDYINFVSDLYH